MQHKRRRLLAWAVGVGALATMATGQAVAGYTCYWANAACLQSGVAPFQQAGYYKTSPIYVNATGKAFFQNPASGYSKRIDVHYCGPPSYSCSLSFSRYSSVGAWVTTTSSTTGVPFVPQQRYVCVNLSSATLGANCGSFDS